MTKPIVRPASLYDVAQYGPDAWDAEHARLRPDVLERIRQERDCAQYRRIVDELRRANEKARTNGNAR